MIMKVEGLSPREIEALKDKIESRCEKDEHTGCWNYSGSVAGEGYRQIKFEQKHWMAHRFVYALYKEQFLSGDYICHICDNRACVNPDHLYLGNAKMNTADAVRRGRLHRVGSIYPK